MDVIIDSGASEHVVNYVSHVLELQRITEITVEIANGKIKTSSNRERLVVEAG